MTDFPDWERFIAQHPQAHILQTAQWAQLKAGFGWEVEPVIVGEAGALLLFRRLPLGLTIAYIPKGPAGQNWPALWPAVDAVCKRRRAVFLKIEPDAWASGGEPSLDEAAFLAGIPGTVHKSQHTVQPPRTILLDIRADEATLLQRMKQKTRYNIRLALKKDVVVGSSGDVAVFSNLMSITGERDQFGVHSQDYYQQAYDLFHPSGNCLLLIAEYNHQPIAGIMVFARGQRAWYFYGASDNAHRNRMPNYLLQWEAIRWARAQGCTEYDLWGVPDVEMDDLEEDFAERSDGLWGVYRFKRGFGGQLARSAGPYDRVYQPSLYRLYLLAYRLFRRGLG